MDRADLIVVGVDGSEHSRIALRWALADATRRGARVEVVRAFDAHRDWPEACGLPPLNLAEVTTQLEATGRAVVRSVVADGGPAMAEVPVDVVALLGSPGDVLVRQAQRADLLVVGHRGVGSGGWPAPCSARWRCTARCMRPAR